MMDIRFALRFMLGMCGLALWSDLSLCIDRVQLLETDAKLLRVERDFWRKRALGHAGA